MSHEGGGTPSAKIACLQPANGDQDQRPSKVPRSDFRALRSDSIPEVHVLDKDSVSSSASLGQQDAGSVSSSELAQSSLGEGLQSVGSKFQTCDAARAGFAA